MTHLGLSDRRPMRHVSKRNSQTKVILIWNRIPPGTRDGSGSPNEITFTKSGWGGVLLSQVTWPRSERNRLGWDVKVNYQNKVKLPTTKRKLIHTRSEMCARDHPLGTRCTEWNQPHLDDMTKRSSRVYEATKTENEIGTPRLLTV